jgi:hypothetical protein
VAIIAVLVMTGLYGVPRILATNNVSNLTQQVALATANYSKIAAQSIGTARTFADSTTDTGVGALGQMGIWPDETLVKTTAGVVTKIANPFGGSIKSKSLSADGALTNLATDEGVWIRLDGIPQTQCFSVASAFLNQAVAVWADGAQPGDVFAEPTTAQAGGATAPKVLGVIDMSKLATLCQTAAGTATTGKPVSVYLLSAY